MIAIEYKGLSASWSSKSEKWISSNKIFTEILNQHLPEEDEIGVDVPFRTYGMDGLVLGKIKDLLGKALKVIAFFPSPAPEEKEGVDY